MESVPNTAEFSRDYQNQQNCPCDPEHMFDCSLNGGSVMNNVAIDGAHATVRGKKFHEKKDGNGFVDSFHERHPRSADASGKIQARKYNPYLEGEPLPVIAKKAPYHVKEPKV